MGLGRLGLGKPGPGRLEPKMLGRTLNRSWIWAVPMLLASVALAHAEGQAAARPSEFLLIAQIALLIAVGRGLGEIMQRIGQPSVIGELLGGLLLGPSVFGLLWPQAQHAIFPARSRAEGADRGDRAVRYPAVVAAHRHGNRSEAGAKGRPSRVLHLGCRHRCAFCLRLRARAGPPSKPAAASGGAPCGFVVPRHRARDLVGQDRRGGGARDEFHAPQSRADHRGHRGARRHHRLDHHRGDLQPRVERTSGSGIGIESPRGNAGLSRCQPDHRPPPRLSTDPVGQRYAGLRPPSSPSFCC